MVASGGGPERSRPSSRRLVIGLTPRPRPSGQLAPQSRDVLDGVLHRDCPNVSAPPNLDLDLALGQCPAAHGDPKRAAHELGVGEFLSWIGISVVVQRV